MLVISKYGIDTKHFDSLSNNWRNSEIRQWLNSDFYNRAFSEDDKKSINFSNLSDVGTSDNVFLLSKKEAEKYFSNRYARKLKATDYAKINGSWADNYGYIHGGFVLLILIMVILFMRLIILVISITAVLSVIALLLCLLCG